MDYCDSSDHGRRATALKYVPLLHLQRELYRLPRGMNRFREYLRTMVDADTGDLQLPLVAMNPMAKEHVLPVVDRLLALDADAEGVRATENARRALGIELDGYRSCLVVSDDLRGGWTNRWAAEYDSLFRQAPLYRRRWMVAILWTSEVYSTQAIREQMLQCIFRAAYVNRRGHAETLDAMMAQEGHVMNRASVPSLALDADELSYTREILAPYRSSTHYPTILAALFGDDAAKQLGHRPLGLATRAGFALAQHEAIFGP